MFASEDALAVAGNLICPAPAALMSTKPVKVPVVPEIAAPPAVVMMVPVASGRVSVLFVLLFGLSIVKMPVPLAFVLRKTTRS